MPKHNPPSKRGKKTPVTKGSASAAVMPAPEDNDPQTSDPIVPEDDTQETQEEEAAAPTPGPPPKPQPKKKYRVPHKEIEDYKFTDDQVQTLVEFIKANPCLYDRKNREFSNNKTKLDLWYKCATMFNPPATYLQCRKFFEQKRTAFGKIEATEMKSGSEARDRTSREDDIMDTWGFLTGHIAHSSTTSSQRFSSGHESSSNSEYSGLSATSIERRKILKKRRVGDVSSNSPAAASDSTQDFGVEGTRVISNLIQRAEALTNKPLEQHSWVGTEIETFSKLMAFQLAKLKTEDLAEVFSKVQALILDYIPKQPSRPPVVQPPPPPPTPAPRLQTPATSGQPWMGMPGVPPMAAGPAFPQTMPYGMPSTSGYHPAAYVAPPMMTPHHIQGQQQYSAPGMLGYSTQASVPAASTPRTAHTVTSPSKGFFEGVDSLHLSPFAPTPPSFNTDSVNPPTTTSLDTPRGEEDPEDDDN